MTHQELIDQAQACLQACSAAQYVDRAESLTDLAYKAGEQWDALARQERGRTRPTLTINKIAAFSHQIVNTYRQTRPGVSVAPVDSQGDPKTADVIAGMLRHVFYVSNGDTASDVAFESAVDIGWGYFRILTDYEDARSFHQDIRYGLLPNPFAVYFDAASVQPDGSDASECVILDNLPLPTFQARYPGASTSPGGILGMSDAIPALWSQGEQVQVAEYYYREEVADTLLLLADGQVLLRSEVPRGSRRALDVVQERPTVRTAIRWCMLGGNEVLEEREVPGAWIPVVPIYGSRILVANEWRRFGMIRWLREPQFMLNYWESAKTELLAQMSKSKWVGAAGQFEGYEESWRTANVNSIAYLEYNVRDIEGNAVGSPQRQYPDPAPQGFIEASLHASQHMKEISGIYDASLGNRSNETSGVAIRNRQQQGDVANFHFFDNAQKSARHAYRIILGMIPTIYDAPRIARILGEDGSASTVAVNASPALGGVATVLHDLTVGKYDVILSSGPNYQTRREDAAQNLSDLLQNWPGLTDIAGHILLQNLDWPGAAEIAKLWKAAHNIPEDATQPVDPAQQLAMASQQLQQAQQQLEQLNAYAQQQEQQLVQLQQEHAAMRASQALDERKIAVEEEKIQLDAQIKAQQLALDQQRLAADIAARGIPPAQMQEGLALVVEGLQSQLDAITSQLQSLSVGEPAPLTEPVILGALPAGDAGVNS